MDRTTQQYGDWTWATALTGWGRVRVYERLWAAHKRGCATATGGRPIQGVALDHPSPWTGGHPRLAVALDKGGCPGLPVALDMGSPWTGSSPGLAVALVNPRSPRKPLVAP
jgi:hypothetical protein